MTSHPTLLVATTLLCSVHAQRDSGQRLALLAEASEARAGIRELAVDLVVTAEDSRTGEPYADHLYHRLQWVNEGMAWRYAIRSEHGDRKGPYPSFGGTRTRFFDRDIAHYYWDNQRVFTRIPVPSKEVLGRATQNLYAIMWGFSPCISEFITERIGDQPIDMVEILGDPATRVDMLGSDCCRVTVDDRAVSILRRTGGRWRPWRREWCSESGDVQHMALALSADAAESAWTPHGGSTWVVWSANDAGGSRFNLRLCSLVRCEDRALLDRESLQRRPGMAVMDFARGGVFQITPGGRDLLDEQVRMLKDVFEGAVRPVSARPSVVLGGLLVAAVGAWILWFDCRRARRRARLVRCEVEDAV